MASPVRQLSVVCGGRPVQPAAGCRAGGDNMPRIWPAATCFAVRRLSASDMTGSRSSLVRPPGCRSQRAAAPSGPRPQSATPPSENAYGPWQIGSIHHDPITGGAPRGTIAPSRSSASAPPLTANSRAYVDEALHSPILKSLSLNASNDVFARHGSRHPLGEGLSGHRTWCRTPSTNRQHWHTRLKFGRRWCGRCF